VQARVIERELRRPRQARAAALQPGTLEILAQAGVIEQVLAHSVQLDFARVFDAALRPVAETAFAGTGAGCPWEFQCSLPQWRTEQILADRLTELGGSVEGGVEAVSPDDTHDRVQVELKHADGAAERTEARWVIGAGGAHSVTCESMAGGVLAGQTYPGTALVADVAVSCNLPRDGSALIASPAGYVLLAPLPDERWLTFAGDLDDDEIGRTPACTTATTWPGSCPPS
jgi:2-polyprenyl-6-methoxyphenol hydroxylase-like FAD-dependent oxidoreductase